MFSQNCTLNLYTVLLFSFFLAVFATNLCAQSVSKADAIEEIFKKYHQYEGFQGAVLVAEKGKVIYRDAFGLANREWNIPNQVDGRFNIASVSKQFTAMLVMQMYEEGKIHLDSTISSYYTSYRPDVGRKVTVHQLLTHRSGIPNYTSIPYVWSDSLVNRYSDQEVVKKFCSGDLEFKPGSRYSYNNSGYLILSVILEKVSGKSFDKLLEENILRPLNMQSTGVDHRSRLLDKRSFGYVKDKETYYNAKPMYMANLQGAGNMYATVDDLYLWDRALHERRLISAKGHKKMMSAYSQESDNWITPFTNSYGYGMGIAKVPGPQNKKLNMVFHSGHITGFSSFMARFVDDEHLVVMLSNLGEVSTVRMNEITQQVKNVLYDLPYEAPQRSIRNTLIKTIRSQNVGAAIRQFEKLTVAFPYEYQDTEGDLYALGQELSGVNRKQDAIEISRLNARINPGWRTYLHLADALYDERFLVEAAHYYQKSSDNNPRETIAERDAYRRVAQTLAELNQ